MTCEKTKERWRKASKKYRENNKEKYRENELKRASTEKGFLKIKYNSLCHSKKGNKFKNFEEFYNVWLHQKNIYNLYCPFSGVKMTTVVGHNRKKEKFETCPTNISIDRLINWKPYSAKNLIFICWKINKIKNCITPAIAKRFVRIAEARFGKKICATTNKDLIYGEVI